jgi:hypothetical protein
MAITLRNTKGVPLTHEELDNNFIDLDTRIDTLEVAADSDNQTLTLAGTDLSISGGNTVSLASLLDNTDIQTLTLAGTDLSISGGNTVDLSSLLDDTNTFVSSASFNNATGDLTLTKNDASTVVVNLDGRYITSETDSQTLSLVGTDLSISGGNTVDLSTFLSSEADTLATVTARGASTTDIVVLTNGAEIGNAGSIVFETDQDPGTWNNGSISATGYSYLFNFPTNQSAATAPLAAGWNDYPYIQPFLPTDIGPTEGTQGFIRRSIELRGGDATDARVPGLVLINGGQNGSAGLYGEVRINTTAGDVKIGSATSTVEILGTAAVNEITQSDAVAGPFGTDTHTTSIIQDSTYTKLNKTDVIIDEFSGSTTYTSSYLFGSNGVRFETDDIGTTFTLRNNTTSGNLDIGSGNGRPVDGERNGGDINIFAGAAASAGVGGNVNINGNGGDIFIGPQGNTVGIKIGGGTDNRGTIYAGGIPTTFYGPVNFNSQTITGTNFLTTVAFGDLTSTPTTLSGYGITDAATSAQGALADTAVQPGNNGGVAYQLGYSAHDAVSIANGPFSVNGTDIVVSLTASNNAQGTRINISGVTTGTSAGTGPIYVERRVNGGSWLTWSAFIVKGADDHFNHSFVDFYDTGGTQEDVSTGDTVEYRLSNGTNNGTFSSNVSGNVDFELFWGFQFTATEIPLSYGLIQP